MSLKPVNNVTPHFNHPLRAAKQNIRTPTSEPIPQDRKENVLNGNDDVNRVELLLRNAQVMLHELQNQRRQMAPRFNVADALGVTRNESSHSEFVAHLLRPMERHDQGELFLTTFLEFLQLDFQPGTTQGASVEREANLAPYGRGDIRVRLANGQNFLIENKIDASEGPGQIGGYQEWLQLQRIPDGFRHRLVFLTPDGRQPVSTRMPEDVVCLSYSQLADWICLSRRQVGPERLGVVLAQYEDTCRLIGGMVRRDAMADAIRQFFLDPDEPARLETALAMEGYLKELKQDIFRRFLEQVAANLSERLQNGDHGQRWNVQLDDNLFDVWSGFRIAWLARHDQPHFAVRVESSFGHTLNGALFYGIKRGHEIALDQLAVQDRELKSVLAHQGFAHAEKWWPSYRYFYELGPHRYDITNNDDVLALHRDMLNQDSPLTHQIADMIWQLFEAHRSTLEQLNLNYPY